VVVGLLQAAPQPALSLLWVATTTATTVTNAAPPIRSRLGLRAAWCTPAGLPGASEPSAARAPETDIAEPVTTVAAAIAIIAIRKLFIALPWISACSGGVKGCSCWPIGLALLGPIGGGLQMNNHDPAGRNGANRSLFVSQAAQKRL